MSVKLSDKDQQMLDGQWGMAAKLSMSILVRMAEVCGAAEMMDVSQAHIDACGILIDSGLEFVETMVRRKDWQTLDAWAARQGVGVVLVSRFIPVISFNLINYAAGLTRISGWAFAVATGIGILPLTVAMVLMGDRVYSLTWQVWVLVGVGSLGLWLIWRRLNRAGLEGDARPSVDQTSNVLPRG